MVKTEDIEVISVHDQLQKRKSIKEIIEIIKNRPYIEWQHYDKNHFVAQGIISEYELTRAYNKMYELLDLFDCNYCSNDPDKDFNLSDVLYEYNKIYDQERLEIDEAINMKQSMCKHELYRPYNNGYQVCENCGYLK
jgi:hypothetical protein